MGGARSSEASRAEDDETQTLAGVGEVISRQQNKPKRLRVRGDAGKGKKGEAKRKDKGRRAGKKIES